MIFFRGCKVLVGKLKKVKLNQYVIRDSNCYKVRKNKEGCQMIVEVRCRELSMLPKTVFILNLSPPSLAFRCSGELFLDPTTPTSIAVEVFQFF